MRIVSAQWGWKHSIKPDISFTKRITKRSVDAETVLIIEVISHVAIGQYESMRELELI